MDRIRFCSHEDQKVLTDGQGFSVSRRFRPVSKLLRPADFQRVFNDPVSSSDPLFRVLACPCQARVSRLGMAVSRKVDRRAVVRNRIKRIVRESFRQAFPRLDRRPVAAGKNVIGNKPGCDYVVIAKPSAARAENVEIRDSLSRHWKKVDEKLNNKAEQARP